MYRKPVTPEEQRMAVAEHMHNVLCDPPVSDIEFALAEALAAHGLTIVEMPVG